MSKGGRYAKKKVKKPLGTGAKVLLIILAVLLVLILAAVIFGVVYYNSMLSKMNQVDVPDIVYTQATAEPTEAAESTPENAQPTEVATTETTEPPHVASSEDYINILVVGQAARESGADTERMADTMILCTVNTYEKTLTLTSILRDSFVKMPDFMGHSGGRIKLTTIYHLGSYYEGSAAGSMALMNQTLYDNFGIEVDHNVEIDFKSFEAIVEALGGVEIELTEAEADYLNNDDLYVYYDMHPGVNLLNGTAALSYARMRKAEGDGESDIKRTARQRLLIEKILEKLKTRSVSSLQRMADEILPMITTSMDNSEITEMLLTLLPMIKDLQLQTGGVCPASGWGDEVDIYNDGTYHSVMRFDVEQTKKEMRAITEGEIQ